MLPPADAQHVAGCRSDQLDGSQLRCSISLEFVRQNWNSYNALADQRRRGRIVFSFEARFNRQ
jgi:hypothetical protein